MSSEPGRPGNPFRILVVDDDPAIRETYCRILQPAPSGIGALEALIGGGAGPAEEPRDAFEVTAAAQGQAAAALNREAVASGRRFQLAFIDMRMPPGWDGLRTASELRAQDPSIYVVIATAFADYDIDELQAALHHDIVLMRKPFNQDEIYQLARTLCQSWETRARLERLTAELEQRVVERTAELAHRVAQHEALADIAARFVTLEGSGDPADAIHWGLARLGRLTSADAAFLIEIPDDAGRLGQVHEWLALGMESLRPGLEALRREEVGPWLVHLARSQSVRCGEGAGTAGLGPLRDLLHARLGSCALVPIVVSARLRGLIGAGYHYPGQALNPADESMLHTAGHLIVGALAARRHENRLLL